MTAASSVAAPSMFLNPLVPVRWVVINGQRQIEQVDTRPGTVRGANESGDLVGTVEIACPAVDGCRRAVIWSASGGW